MKKQISFIFVISRNLVLLGKIIVKKKKKSFKLHLIKYTWPNFKIHTHTMETHLL